MLLFFFKYYLCGINREEFIIIFLFMEKPSQTQAQRNQKALKKYYKKLSKMTLQQIHWSVRSYQPYKKKKKQDKQQIKKQIQKIQIKKTKSQQEIQIQNFAKHQQFIQKKKGFLFEEQQHFFQGKLLLAVDRPNDKAIYLTTNQNNQKGIQCLPISRVNILQEDGDIVPMGRINIQPSQIFYQCNKCGSQYLKNNQSRHSCQYDFKMTKGQQKICKKCLKKTIKNHKCKDKQQIWPNIITTRHKKTYQQLDHKDYVLNNEIFQDPQYVISFFMALIKQNICEDTYNLTGFFIHSNKQTHIYNRDKIRKMLGIPQNRIQVLKILIDVICVKLQKSKISIYDLFDHYIKSLHPFKRYLPLLTFQEIIESFDQMIRLCWLIDQESLQISKQFIDKQLHEFLKDKKYVFDSQLKYRNFNSNQMKGIFLTQPICGQNNQQGYIQKAKQRLMVFRPQKWQQKYFFYQNFDIRHPVAQYHSKLRPIQIYALSKEIRIILKSYNQIKMTVQSQFNQIIRAIPKNRCNATNTTFTKDYLVQLKRKSKIKRSINQKITPQYMKIHQQVQAYKLFYCKDFRQDKITQESLKRLKMSFQSIQRNKYASMIIQITYKQPQVQLGKRRLIKCSSILEAKTIIAKLILKKICYTRTKSFTRKDLFKNYVNQSKYDWYYLDQQQNITLITLTFTQLISLGERNSILKQILVVADKDQQIYKLNQQVFDIKTKQMQFQQGLVVNLPIDIKQWVINNSKIQKLKKPKFLYFYKLFTHRNVMIDENGQKTQYQQYANIQGWYPKKIIQAKYIQCYQSDLLRKINQTFKQYPDFLERMVVFSFQIQKIHKSGFVQVNNLVSTVKNKNFVKDQQSILKAIEHIFERKYELNQTLPKEIPDKYQQVQIQQTFQKTLKRIQNISDRQFCLQDNHMNKMMFDDQQLEKRIEGNKLTKQFIRKIENQAKISQFSFNTERYIRSFKHLQIYQQYDLIYQSIEKKVKQLLKEQRFINLIKKQLNLYWSQLLQQHEIEQRDYIQKIKLKDQIKQNLFQNQQMQQMQPFQLQQMQQKPYTIQKPEYLENMVTNNSNQIKYVLKIVDQGETIGILKPKQMKQQIKYKSRYLVWLQIQQKIKSKKIILEQNIVNKALNFMFKKDMIFIINNNQILANFIQYCKNKEIKSFQQLCLQGKFDYGSKNTVLYKKKKQQYQSYNKYLANYRSFKRDYYQKITNSFINQDFMNQNQFFYLDSQFQSNLLQFQQSLLQKVRSQIDFIRQNFKQFYDKFIQKNQFLQSMLKSVLINIPSLKAQSKQLTLEQAKQYEIFIQKTLKILFKKQQWMKIQKSDEPITYQVKRKIKLNQFRVVQIQQLEASQTYQMALQSQKQLQNQSSMQTQIKKISQLIFFGQLKQLKCDLCMRKLFCGDYTVCKNRGCPNSQVFTNYCEVDNQIRIPQIQNVHIRSCLKLRSNKSLIKNISQKNKNKIKDTILRLNKNCYYSQIPSFMGTLRQKIIKTYNVKLSIEAIKAVDQYLQYSQYSPLFIKQSNIKNAGLGVFATDSFQKDTIVSTYSGNIFLQNEFKFNEDMDSIVEIGYIQKKLINLTPQTNINVGRYFNSSKNKNKINMIPKFIIHNYKGKNILLLLLIANRKIQKDQQLIWNYGEDFFQKKIDNVIKGNNIKTFNVYTNQYSFFNQQQYKIYQQWVSFEKKLNKIRQSNYRNYRNYLDQTEKRRKNGLHMEKSFVQERFPNPPKLKGQYIGNYNHLQMLQFAKWQLSQAKFKGVELYESNQWQSRINKIKQMRYQRKTSQYQQQQQPKTLEKKIIKLKKQVKKQKKQFKFCQKEVEIFDNIKKKAIQQHKAQQSNKLLSQLTELGAIGINLNQKSIYLKQGPIYMNVYASLVKLINLITCIDIMKKLHIMPCQVIQIPQFKKQQSATRIGIQKGYKMKIQQLFLAMCVSSSYQAAKALALYFGTIQRQLTNQKLQKKTRETQFRLRSDVQNQLISQFFVKKMTQKIDQLGLKHTIIKDDAGLSNSAYTSVQDMLKVIRYLQINGYDKYMRLPNSAPSMKIQVLDQFDRIIQLKLIRTINTKYNGIWGKTGLSSPTIIINMANIHSFAGFIQVNDERYSVVVLGQATKAQVHSALQSCRKYILQTIKNRIEDYKLNTLKKKLDIQNQKQLIMVPQEQWMKEQQIKKAEQNKNKRGRKKKLQTKDIYI